MKKNIFVLLILLPIFIYGCGSMNVSSPDVGSSGSQSAGVIPTDPAAVINNGDTTTDSTSVGIVISVIVSKEVTDYYLSEMFSTPESSSSNWKTVGTATRECWLTVPYNLTSSAGEKKVYLWFKNSDGDVSNPASNTIYLEEGSTADTTPPYNPTININNGSTTTATSTVNISIGAIDNTKIISYYISQTLSTPESTSTVWVSVTPEATFTDLINYILTGGTGVNIVYIWYRDAGSNVSNPASYSITYSTVSSGESTSWTKLFGSSSWDCGYSIAAADMIFVGGSTNGSIVGTNAGKLDLFGIKYDGAGTLVGTTQEGTSSSDEAKSLLYEPTWGGDVFLIGYSKGNMGDNSPTTGNIIVNGYRFDLDGRLGSSQLLLFLIFGLLLLPKQTFVQTRR